MSKIATTATPASSSAPEPDATAASEAKPPVYQGPAQFFELRVPDGEGTKLVPLDCVPGQPLDIAEDHPVAVALTAAGFLASATE